MIVIALEIPLCFSSFPSLFADLSSGVPLLRNRSLVSYNTQRRKSIQMPTSLVSSAGTN